MSQSIITEEEALKLAKAHEKKGNIEGAVELYQLVLTSFPQNKRAKRRLKILQKSSAKNAGPAGPTQQQIDHLIQLYSSGMLTEAISQARLLINDYPDNPTLHNLLGVCNYTLGQLNDAVNHYGRALELNPNYAEAHNNLGITLSRLGRLKAAIETYKRALEIKPDYFEALNNLGITFKNLGEIGDAIGCFENALDLKPDYVEAYNNLGNALQSCRRLDEAATAYRKALEIKPDYENAFGNLLFTLNYAPDLSAEEIYSAYQEYDARYCMQYRSQWQAHTNSPDPDRRLKIGYVSPDLTSHSIRHFLEPLLSNHDRSQFDVVAFAEVFHEDDVTARYKTYVDSWVRTNGLSDEALAELIRKDGIDILIDLAGHTRNCRLGVMARKPAPVSISTMGYGCTTGLSAIDYFMWDETALPLDSNHLFSETPWPLRTPGMAYRPADGMGAVNQLPALASGSVTFGTLTRAIRINHHTIRVWSEILKRIEGARLVINSNDFSSAEMQAQLVDRFVAEGIDPARLEIGFASPPWDVMRGMDIALDCFPHNSGTTLYEHLYLGVPFITLASRPSVGRIGAAVLEGIGHPEWIANSEEEYVTKAVALASDLKDLATIRSGLREKMQNSPLMDEPGFARKVESAYRQMWQQWCNASPTP